MKCFTQDIQYFGKAGKGQHAKLSNQIICAGAMIGVVEGLLYASKMKLDLHQMVETTMKGFGNSVYLSTFGHRIVDRDFKAMVKAEHFAKDMGLALD